MANRREQILVAAYGLMGTKGLEHVHARTVAADVGVNHATVHYYFPKRPDLLLGIAEYAEGILQEDRGRFHQVDETPQQALEAELALVEAYCKRNSRFVKVLAGLYVASLADANLKKRLRALWASWAGTIRDLVAWAKVPKGSPFADPDLLMATLFGLGLASHLNDGQPPAAPALAQVSESLWQARRR